MLSFFSINNVYATENELITSDIAMGTGIAIGNDSDIGIDTVDISVLPESNLDNPVLEGDDLNQDNIALDENIDFQNESMENISNKTEDSINNSVSLPSDKSVAMDYSSPMDMDSDHDKNITDNTNVPNRDNLEKIETKSTKLESIDSDDFYSIINYYDPNSEGISNDLGDYLNQDIILSVSSFNFKGNGFDSFKIFNKKVAIINFKNIDNDEDISIIQDFQSSSNVTLTILFFIKIFMDFHNNGKEHLNSF
ncbi:MAG: hypothetical protein FWH54_04335 [Methanobrevibacter sp.]|nr:hypothetical protein [Methanobrevibacter sp.]